MNNTFLIIAVVVVIWAVLFVIMMSFNKKRKAKSKEFIVNNRNKAVIHLYGKNLKIDGKDISQFESVTGENLEKIVAIEGGVHSFEGIFETTAVSITGKNINMKTEKLQFEVELKSGHSYSAVLYDYSPEERKEYTKEDVENEIRGNKEYQSLLKGYETEDIAKFISIFTSVDNDRCSGIINGLWVLGLIRTKDNINGFNYSKTKRIGISPVRWFASEKYIIDYETIKKYFGKYKLIREFCDSRETQKLEEEKDTFEKILPYLEQMKNRVEVNKDEAEKVLREVSKEEVKEILEKVEKYLKDNEIGIIKFDTGGMRTREHVFGFFEENVIEE